MATPAHDARPNLPSASLGAQTLRYRGPTVLLGALAHLLREEGLEFDQPSNDRRVTDAAVSAVLVVTPRDAPRDDLTLEEMIESAVMKFTRRFGDDSASVAIGADDSAR